MRLAVKEAYKALRKDEVPVGCIISFNGKIFRAYNMTLKNPLLHAEFIAINKALRFVRKKFLNGAILYSTLEPCPMCAMAISLVRIEKVYFILKDNNYGAYTKLKMHKLNIFKPEVIKVKFPEYKNVFTQFFRKLRS